MVAANGVSRETGKDAIEIWVYVELVESKTQGDGKLEDLELLKTEDVGRKDAVPTPPRQARDKRCMASNGSFYFSFFVRRRCVITQVNYSVCWW